MLQIFFSFFEEIILLLFILGGILLSSFFKRKKEFLTDVFYQKKVYYLFFRLTFVTLLICLGISSYSLLQFTVLERTYDSLAFGDFYFYQVVQPFSYTFFRKDLFSVFLNVLLTFMILFYTFLVYDTHKVTTNQTKYYLEIPVLLITIFLSLKLFLYTYDLMLIVITLELTAFCSLILLSLQITSGKEITNIFPFEAAIKYFIFNAVAISLFLFSIGGYYALYKSVNLLDFGLFTLFEPGFSYENLETLIFIQFFFFAAYFIKIGVAPFHQWVPDVYEGAELLITAFLVLIIGPALNFKLFSLIKLLLPIFDQQYLLFNVFLVSGLLSVMIGSFNAMLQTRIKRFLAYTGISHLGYILISLGSASYLGFFASFFYLFFYILTNLIFFSLLLITKRLSGISIIFLNHLKLLVNDNFLLFGFFLIPLLSFAGFPPFAGFFSKFFMLASVVDQQNISFLLMLVFYIVLSAYLYLRFIKIAIFEKLQQTYFFPIKHFEEKNYYTVSTSLKSMKAAHDVLQVHHTLLLILFFGNIVILFTLAFLPTFCLLFQQPLLALFLFY